ncbi:MAG: type II secretion system protein GspM [Pseudomonadota bacterium]
MANLLAQYSSREKTIVIIAFVVLILLGCHALVIEPYQEKRAALKEAIAQQNSDLNWMRSVVPKLPLSGPSVQTSAISGSLANFIDQLVRGQGLANQLSQMSPVGENEIRMRFSEVDFNRLIGFIARIHASGLDIKDIRITATDTPGQVISSLAFIRK